MLASWANGMRLPNYETSAPCSGPSPSAAARSSTTSALISAATTADCESFGENYQCIEGICKGDTRASASRRPIARRLRPNATACIEKERGNPVRPPASGFAPRNARSSCRRAVRDKSSGRKRWRRAIPSSWAASPKSTRTASPPSPPAYDLAFSELQEKRGGVPVRTARYARSSPSSATTRATPSGSTPAWTTSSKICRARRIAALRSDQLLPLFSDVRELGTNPNVYFMSPVEADSTLSNIRRRGPHLDVASERGPACRRRTSPCSMRTIDYLIAHRRVAEGTPIKVSLVYAPTTCPARRAHDAVEDMLVFNGKSFRGERRRRTTPRESA